MRASELHDTTDDELMVKERELTESLFLLRLRHATNQLESPARLRETRRDLARVKTLRRARTLASEQ